MLFVDVQLLEEWLSVTCAARQLLRILKLVEQCQ